jgi:hypothetical protein
MFFRKKPKKINKILVLPTNADKDSGGYRVGYEKASLLCALLRASMRLIKPRCTNSVRC